MNLHLMLLIFPELFFINPGVGDNGDFLGKFNFFTISFRGGAGKCVVPVFFKMVFDFFLLKSILRQLNLPTQQK